MNSCKFRSFAYVLKNCNQTSKKYFATTKPVQFNRTFINSKKSCNKLNFNVGLYLPQYHFHTTNRRNFIPPAIWLFVKPAAKIASMISGRIIRKHYQSLSPEKQVKFRNKYRGIFGSGIIAACLALVVTYNYHLKETPVTKRKRYIAFNNDQIMKLVIEESNELIKSLQSQILPANDQSYERVNRIVSHIMNSNQDLEFFQEQAWTLIVVDSPEANAFVLPTGHIFVFKGLLDMAKSDDQLAVVIGHEMSHALLQHGAEKIAVAQLIDYVIIVLMAAMWAIMPNDGIAIVTQWFYHKVVDLFLTLPYSRKLETEADEVGLYLIAKACYDVREAPNFWLKMHVQTLMAVQMGNEEYDVPEYISTHPSHDNRANRLNAMTPIAEEMRRLCKCEPLSKYDPRNEGIILYQMYEQYKQEEQAKQIDKLKEEKAAQEVEAIKKSLNETGGGKRIEPPVGINGVTVS